MQHISFSDQSHIIAAGPIALDMVILFIYVVIFIIASSAYLDHAVQMSMVKHS